MEKVKTYVLSIAGFDPCGGAGILADIKTFEEHKVYGMGVVSVLTFQNDITFDSLRWIGIDEILKQIAILNERFEFKVIKIGLIQNLEVLEAIITYCKKTSPDCLIIWDPIIKASAGFEFHSYINREKLLSLLNNIFLITPNADEVKSLTGIINPGHAARELSKYCNVLLKGGHNQEEIGVDYLYIQNHIEKILPGEGIVYPKHGSGCVLSSAVVSNLALGKDIIVSCRNAKIYIEQFLSSNQSLLGNHNVQ